MGAPEANAGEVYMDVHQAAKRYGLNFWWFYHAASEGKIPIHHFGKYLRFRVDELDAYFEGLDAEAAGRRSK